MALVHFFRQETGVSCASTFGGSGWRPRLKAHVQEIQEGRTWRRLKTQSETEPLREILLVRPGDWLSGMGDPNDALFSSWPDVCRIQEQADQLASAFTKHGVHVHWLEVAAAPPNLIFMRDLFFMTPEGAILARPASLQRAGEARLVQQALAHLSIPILGSPRGCGLFEGADALWLNEITVMVGVGNRTNDAGAEYLEHILGSMGITVVKVTLPDGVQHLLGIVNFVSANLAVVRSDRATAEIVQTLQRYDICTVPYSVADSSSPFDMNFVATSPGRLIVPSGYPASSSLLSLIGADITEVDMSEYIKAMGGVGCTTGVISRGAKSIALFEVSLEDATGGLRRQGPTSGRLGLSDERAIQ